MRGGEGHTERGRLSCGAQANGESQSDGVREILHDGPALIATRAPMHLAGITVILVVAAMVSLRAMAAPAVVLASTTSVQDSGLYDHILPVFYAGNGDRSPRDSAGRGPGARNSAAWRRRPCARA